MGTMRVEARLGPTPGAVPVCWGRLVWLRGQDLHWFGVRWLVCFFGRRCALCWRGRLFGHRDERTRIYTGAGVIRGVVPARPGGPWKRVPRRRHGEDDGRGRDDTPSESAHRRFAHRLHGGRVQSPLWRRVHLI